MCAGVVLVGRLKDTVIEEEQEWMAAGWQRNGVNVINRNRHRQQCRPIQIGLQQVVPQYNKSSGTKFCQTFPSNSDAFGTSRFPQQQNQRHQSEAFGNCGFHSSGPFDPHQQGHVTSVGATPNGAKPYSAPPPQPSSAGGSTVTELFNSLQQMMHLSQPKRRHAIGAGRGRIGKDSVSWNLN
ncbi:hypothetical protein quinque_003608 [Culex quinquefasciatus]